MKRWSGLAGLMPASPLIRYLVIAIALGILALAGLTISGLLHEPAEQGEPLDGGTPTGSASGGSRPFSEGRRLLLPLVRRSGMAPSATPHPSATPSVAPSVAETTRPVTTTRPAPPTQTPTPTPVNFDAVRQQLQAEGKDLAHVKIGFHTGPGGNARGLGEFLTGLADAGVPTMIKSADAYGPCAEALRASPDHVTVFRMSGGDLELPNYDLSPEVAAEEHWTRILAALPPEFDRRTWLEVMNEPDKERADWLGRCSYRLAELALRDGYRFAAFGWSSGEPEPDHWRTPGVEAFLSLAAQYPDRLAVALHEYSYSVDDIANQYPALVGRFQALFRACDEMGIERPTVLITEWGWQAENVPPVDQAMEDIEWASKLYGAYPEVKGAAIWYLGPGYGGIANDVQRLILPLRYYAWSNYFVIEPGQEPRDPLRFAP
jgi:hypothetical protein